MKTTTLTREETVAEAREASQTFLERICVETRRHIAIELAPPCKEKKSEHTRVLAEWARNGKVEIDDEYGQGKRDNGLETPLSDCQARAYYTAMFSIYS